MSKEVNTQHIRPLTSHEMDIVSGGEKYVPVIEVRLPGQVTVQVNKESGCFAVWLGGKVYAEGGC